MKNIKSSQRGFENVAEGTKYDDYHIDTTGMGILDVEHIINEIEGRGNQAVLTVKTSDGATQHTQFNAKDWKAYKDAVNGVDEFSRNSRTKGAAITDVWITEVEGGSYVRNSRRPIKSDVDPGYEYEKSPRQYAPMTNKHYNSALKKAERMVFDKGIFDVDLICKETGLDKKDVKSIIDVYNGDISDDFDEDIQSSRRPIKSSVRWSNDDYIVETFESGNGEFYVSDKDTDGKRFCKTFWSEKDAVEWAKNNPLKKVNSSRQIKSAFTPEEKHSIGDIDFYDIEGSRDREGNTFSCGGDLGDCWADSAWYDSDTKQLHFGNAYFNSHRDMTDEDAKDYFSETISYYLDDGFNGDELVHDFCERIYSSRQIKSARRPIKSSKEYFEMDSYITGRDHMTDFLGFTCDVTKNGDKFEWSNVQSWFSNEDFVDPESRIYGVYDNQEQFLDDVIYFLDSEQGQDVMQEEYEKKKEEGHVWDEHGYQVSDDYFYSDPAVELDNWSDNWSENEHIDSSRKITSARYIATDPESGEVLGSADTYEEAVNEWGEDVTITDSESDEGNDEHSDLFSSRKITSAVDGGWEVRSSDVPEALDLFVEYFGEEDALEEIAKAMDDNTLEENIDYIAQQWGFAEDIEELDNAWDKYETAKEIMGESELFNNLTQAAGYDELAADLAFIFRMNDFREWDKYDNEEDEREIDDDVKDYALFDLLYDTFGKDMATPIENAIYDAECFDEIFEEYESKGGEYTDEDDPCFDDKELAISIINKVLDEHGIDTNTIQPESPEITSNRSFPVKTVKNILSGKWSEDYAAECIAQKQDINVGYARQILSSWIEQYKPKLIKSGILDIAEDINAEFDIDGDLESWAEQYTNDSGKSNTVGGEMVRAAMQIIYRYNNDGDMIGRGYGNETVNAAARYITEKAEMGVNEQIQKWLDHEERADDYDYDNFIETFTTEIEQILRENPELFQKPNKDDYWNWKTEDDVDVGFDECYLEDGDGNQYWFQKASDDRWTCTGIELDPNAHTYSEGDTINEGDEFSDEILSPSEEFGSFEAEGLIYEYSGEDWDEEREQYTSWQITKVTPADPYCDEGDTFDFYDLEPDELYGYTLFDHNGNEIDERTFLASSLIKSVLTADEETVIEILKNGHWEFVSLDNNSQGWSTDKQAKVFPTEEKARSSTLAKRVQDAGYSEDTGTMKFSRYSKEDY